MNNNVEINQGIEEIYGDDEVRYKFNFINEPWDDRSKNSKMAIVTLLVSIFVVTTALVTNNIVIHYSSFDHDSYGNSKIYCNLVNVDKYPFVARIYSVNSGKPVCVAIVVSPNSVLANDICLQSGPIRLHLGSVTDPRCKKEFSVDIIDPIFLNGSVTKKLVLLTTFGNTFECAETIDIGTKIDFPRVHIIGRPYRGDKTLSFQIAEIVKENTTFQEVEKSLNENNSICVRALTKCPIRVGDVLLQHSTVLGLALTSVHESDQKKIACFAKLSNIRNTILKGSHQKELIMSD